MGPLNGLLFLFAKIRPGDCGGILLPFPKAALDSVRPGGNPERTRRMLEGKLEDVGVAGRTLMLLWGDLEGLCEWLLTETAGEASEAEDVDEAFECE
jgi:hypothetical protein